MTIEKNKNLFIITLGDGKKTYFNFSDNCIYGMTGKKVKDFCPEAKKILKTYADNDFLARYFAVRNKYSDYYFTDVDKWSTEMVETIYSIFGKDYNLRILGVIAYFCSYNNYVLDKQGVKYLKLGLASLEEHQLRDLCRNEIEVAVRAVRYSNVNSQVLRIMNHVRSEVHETILKDADKILFRMEHECWEQLDGFYSMSKAVERYITLCNELGKERTYKNMFLTICQMEMEKRLALEAGSKDYQLNANLAFEDNNFVVLVPTVAKEFEAEANYQSNCVYRAYYPKVLKHETHIVFIRHKAEPEKPYITCEVNNDGEIVQYLTRFNNCVDWETDVLGFQFQKTYADYLSKNFNKNA